MAVRIDQVTIPYLVGLLHDLQPHALLVPETEPIGVRRRSPHTARCIDSIVAEAHVRGIAVHVLNSQAVKAAFKDFSGDDAGSLRDVYERIIEEFPEMQLLMPRPRLKVWDPEQYFEPLFNTVAMFLTWRRQPSPMDRRRRGVA